MERRKNEWEGRMITKMIILELVEGVERQIAIESMKEIIDDVVEEAAKERQVKIGLKAIEGSGPIIPNRMEIFLRLSSIEEEKAVRLMLEEENRDRRKELQELKKESWK